MDSKLFTATVAVAALLAGPAALAAEPDAVGGDGIRETRTVIAQADAADSADGGRAPRSVVFAGGCFWCVESDFDSVEGVLATTSGFTGGHARNPTYRQVSRGGTGHYESVRIEYDPDVVSFRELADKFFRSVDPTDDGGQFCDRGSSYRTAIFVSDPAQRSAAEDAKASAQAALGMAIVTPVLDAQRFYPAGDRHQDYYKGDNLIITRFGIIEQSDAYKRYREACGRDERVRSLWGDQAAFAHGDR